MRLFSLKNIQFDQIIQSIQSYLTNSSGTHKTINKSTVFGQLITIMAGLAHNIMLYIEDALTEQNKYTVQRKKSVVGLAAFSGYQPSYGKAAGVWVQISHQANNEQSLDVIVPDHTRILCSQNGLYYNLVLNKSAMVIKSDINLTNNYYYAVQGKFEVQRFSAIGGRLYCQNFKFLGFIDTDYIEVRVNGEVCGVTFKEYELLNYLMINKGIVLSRENIMDRIWGMEYEGESRTLDMHIKTLRQKLGGSGGRIKTVRNVGYILE